MAIRPGWKENSTAILALGAHNLAVFQIANKVICLCDGSKAYCSEFFKPVIYLFFCAHFLSP